MRVLKLLVVGCFLWGACDKQTPAMDSPPTPALPTAVAESPRAAQAGAVAMPKGSTTLPVAKRHKAPASRPSWPEQKLVPPPLQKGSFAPGKLVKEPAAKILQKLRQAHYDPFAQGLKRLEFSIVFTAKGTDTKVQASGRWHPNAPADITVKRVFRKGKELRDGKNRPRIVQSLGVLLRRVLDGLGRGFLTRRLDEFSTGKATRVEKLPGGNLRLHYALKADEFESTVVVDVAEGYRIARLGRSSHGGVMRSMVYSYQLEKGRNLVQEAKLDISFAPGTKLSRKAKQQLSGAKGSLYRLTYKRFGRFLLPTRLYRKMPQSNDEMSLDLTFSKVE